MRLSGPGPFIADIGPKPRSSGFTGAWSQHLYRRVIGKDGLSLEGMLADGVDQGFQKRGRFTNPTGLGGAIQIAPLAIVNLTLPVQR